MIHDMLDIDPTQVDVAWAHPATAVAADTGVFPSNTGISPYSRGCPAKDLSFVMATQFMRALRASNMQSWEHPDPNVFKADGDFPNDPITMGDVTPFVSEFVLRKKGHVDMNLDGTINPGGYGCGMLFRPCSCRCRLCRLSCFPHILMKGRLSVPLTASDNHCKPINSAKQRKCFTPSSGPGKCLAFPQSLGPNRVCYMDEECMQNGGEAGKCEKSTLHTILNWFVDRPGICKGRLSHTEVEAPLPEYKCKTSHNPNDVGDCVNSLGQQGKDCAWCFSFGWNAKNGQCVRDATVCPQVSPMPRPSP